MRQRRPHLFHRVGRLDPPAIGAIDLGRIVLSRRELDAIPGGGGDSAVVPPRLRTKARCVEAESPKALNRAIQHMLEQAA
jgi:hypothetical protein